MSEQQWSAGDAAPASEGKYLRQYPKTAYSDACVRRSYWDGKVWFRAEVMRSGASKNPPHRLASAFQFLPWRALNK